MIVSIRIDDRLMHGQVAYNWINFLSVQAVVVMNAKAANDDMRKMALKLCVPDGVKIAVRNLEDATQLLRKPQLQKMKVLVVCESPRDAYEILEKIDEHPVINLGGQQNGEYKKTVISGIYCSRIDFEYLDKIVELGYKINIQLVPSSVSKEYVKS